MFNALVLNKDDDNKVTPTLTSLEDSALPEGDVLVKIDYSTLNYKDGLVLGGLGGLVRNYPHVPGIDFAGTVEHSEHGQFKAGDKVVLTGWRVGEMHWGGYSQKARVQGDWLVPLPSALTTQQAMAIGTAGLTAMLGVLALESQGLTPADGPVLVMGAAGGVGSVAAALLSKAGYEVHGSSGRPDMAPYLKSLGISEIIARDELAESNNKPLNKERWAGAIDSVGGVALANVLTQIRYGGSVAAIGLAGGSSLETTVIPFLLRGVNLLGIDSVMCPIAKRMAAWDRLGQDLDPTLLESMTTISPLADAPKLGASILKGDIRGRLVIDVNA
ncbi:MAG: oxidoreductase [Gammaproteobacteria bacterium]|nr:oxidoreductase [Gammaproteobacteria bacterium]